MEISGWGHHPVIDATLIHPRCLAQCQRMVQREHSLIARGKGRSYGDSSLAATVLTTQYLNHFLTFDVNRGILSCQAGVSLADILSLTVPQGWFLPVVPGTKYVSIGGAIASDIHGKNHPHAGCFSQWVSSLKLMLASGEVMHCSHQHNQELFQATCGGMGLTGIILEATLQLQSISSPFIQQSITPTTTLEQMVQLLSQQTATYSVGWLDLTSKANIHGFILSGTHLLSSDKIIKRPHQWNIPCLMPGLTLNRWVLKAFNRLYRQVNKQDSTCTVHYEDFFFSLDKVQHWNRLYGKQGFVQYQCVIPHENGIEPLHQIITCIRAAKLDCYLAVLKKFGPANDNYLSFPIKGLSLALDFKANQRCFEIFKQLDEIIVNNDGRLYLSKDARQSAQTLAKTYSKLNQFTLLRQDYLAMKKFNSRQSMRLGI